jgi:hypothetical protein
MTDDLQRRLRPQERVAAGTGVFGQPVPFAHAVHAMSEQAAQVTDLLWEGVLASMGIARLVEQEGVAAAFAEVLVMPFSSARTPVAVMPQETRQRVTDPRRAAVAGQDGAAAPADAVRCLPEDPIVDRVAQARSDPSSATTHVRDNPKVLISPSSQTR